MLAPGVPAEGTPAPESAREAASAAVSRQLTEDAVTVLPAEEARRRLVDELHAECTEIGCGGAVVRSLGVDFAVLVTVWAPSGEPSSVSIALIGADDSLGGEAPIEDGNVVSAALRALTIAYQRWQASQMGFVEVSSTPPGADVRIDGRPVGETPLRRLVMQGERTVSVSLQGHTSEEQRIEVAPTQSHPVAFALVPVMEELPVNAPSSGEADLGWLNWVAGIGLVAGSVGAAIAPVHTLARLGECHEQTMGGVCRTEVQFGAVSGVLLGVSAIALGVGVTLLVIQPFGGDEPVEVDVSAQPEAASVRVSGRF